VLSKVGVAANGQPPTISELREILFDSMEIDRTQINSWQDVEFRQAVQATGRKKLIMTTLWTEVCRAFPALDALREGNKVSRLSARLVPTQPTALKPLRLALRVLDAGGHLG
jgi:hypothetical protein